MGRLVEEKGLRVLLSAWSQHNSKLPLRIAGDGPLKNEIAEKIAAQNLTGITMLGSLSGEEVIRAMQGARCLVVPSIWYEGFPMNIAEAFSLWVCR